MNRKQAKRSSIFLLELMIAILFFCLASAVCIRLVVKSHIISQEARNLNMAVNQVSAIAEVFRSGADIEQFLQSEFTDYEKEIQDSSFCVYYNGEWKVSEKKDAVFCLSIKTFENETKITGCFSMEKIETNEEIYAVSMDRFTGRAMR